MADEDKPWDPEDEKLPDQVGKKLNEMLDMQLERMKKEGPGMGAQFLGPAIAINLSITIKPVENGFIIRWSDLMDPPPEAPPGTPPQFKSREVFAKDVEDALPYLKAAFESLNKLNKL